MLANSDVKSIITSPLNEDKQQLMLQAVDSAIKELSSTLTRDPFMGLEIDQTMFTTNETAAINEITFINGDINVHRLRRLTKLKKVRSKLIEGTYSDLCRRCAREINIDILVQVPEETCCHFCG